MPLNYLIKTILLLIVFECTQMVDLNVGNSELTLKMLPSLIEDDNAHVYQVLAYCNDEKGEILDTVNDHSKSIKLPLASSKENLRHVFDDVFKLMFNSTDCDGYRIHIWVVLRNDQHWLSWPASYKSVLENSLINHRILFGNYFQLSISPALEDSDDHFYSIRVYCEEETVNNENGKKQTKFSAGALVDEHEKYMFKTYTKDSTMVVFNSEERQCTNSNTYHIKVWAVHKQWLYSNPSNSHCLVHYVCLSRGNGERRHISFLNHFHLQITPKLPKNDAEIYYVEIQCQNDANEQQTFKTVTADAFRIVLHKFVCKKYDILAQKVPKKWTKQIELHKSDIAATRGASESNVTIGNGYIYIFDYEKCVNNWQNRRRRSDNNNNHNDVQSHGQTNGHNNNNNTPSTSKQLAATVHIDDNGDEEEEEEEKEEYEYEPERKKAKKLSEIENDCYYFFD